jgi:hypothetical protein
MDVLERHLVNVRLGLRQPADELDGARLHARRERRGADETFDLGERPMTDARRMVMMPTITGPMFV